MARSKKCTLIVNTSYGYCFSPVKCNSIKEAVEIGKTSEGFAYRIVDENNKVIKKGFCSPC